MTSKTARKSSSIISAARFLCGYGNTKPGDVKRHGYYSNRNWQTVLEALLATRNLYLCIWPEPTPRHRIGASTSRWSRVLFEGEAKRGETSSAFYLCCCTGVLNQQVGVWPPGVNTYTAMAELSLIELDTNVRRQARLEGLEDISALDQVTVNAVFG